MKSRFDKIKKAMPERDPADAPAGAVVDFSDARQQHNQPRRASYNAASSNINPAALGKEIAEARELLEQGLTSEAETRLRKVVATAGARQNASLLAQARCALSEALSMFGRYRESLEAVVMYETPEARTQFDAELEVSLRVQIGLAYNYTGDHPKAIALLNATLQHELAGGGSDMHLGAIYNALARVYRTISEHTIARDHVHKALEHYRRTGDWRGLAESYIGIATADMQEGAYETSLENYKQALKLVGHHPAPYLLGKLYGNMAGACWFLRRPHDGIAYLEKAINYYERTDHTTNAAIGYNNLGINLILVGKWERAHEVLKRALSIASEANENSAQVPTILESLGELQMLRGDLDEAKSLLERAVKLSIENSNKWYAVQAMRTLCRCLLAMNDTASALVKGEGALSLAERIGDRQAICESSLLLSEAYLQEGSTEECSALLQKVLVETADNSTDLSIAGETQRISGMLEFARGDATLAANHFGKCISIFEMLGDQYRTARAHYWLGRAHTSSSLERAKEHLSLAVHTFRELGASIDLERAEEALAALNKTTPEQERHSEASTLSQLLTLRLAEAVASRELLLRELAAVLHQETSAQRVLIAEAGEDGRPRVVVAHGCSNAESTRIAEGVIELKTDAERMRFAGEHNATVVQLKSMNATPVMLFIAPRGEEVLPGGASIEPLLRVVELGMDVCALRARAKIGRDTQNTDTLAGASLMPGFIHSSPAMTRLVDEVHKIRSSDVTVLVTGESGTGKELVARAIHALSTRRSKVFVPFNCTAVPKELTEGYLFGYRRGAFTGAVADSPGVIRAAIGGTLFLDEIGDLPLDVQPKLLRFLQEGEVQPLGEQRPSKVDVRIIAATNSDLERMVAEGRFREDLYYRLNVIRLNVPPLRERRSEIPTIVNYYLNHYSAKFGRRDIQITPQAIDLLMVSDWPGNVRQLCNEVQRVVARAEDGTLINADHLSPELRHTSVPVATRASVTPIGAAADAIAADASKHGMTLADALSELERRMISEALQKHSGNISRAARELGLTRRGLYLKLERYQLSLTA